MQRLSGGRRGGLLLALLLSVAVATGLVVATGSLLDHRADEGVQGEVAGLSGDDRALRLSLPLAADAVEQDAVVRAAITGDFARATAGVSIDRSVEGRVELTFEGDDAFSGPIEALSVPDIDARADLVAGTWSGASGITMQADAAAALGIDPGDIVALNGEPFEMTGTWRVRDALDPRWDRLVARDARCGARAGGRGVHRRSSAGPSRGRTASDVERGARQQRAHSRRPVDDAARMVVALGLVAATAWARWRALSVVAASSTLLARWR